MGLYLNPPSDDKLQWLLKNATTVELDEQAFTDPATDKVTVCLVDNGEFMAAGVADSPEEFAAFNREEDTRPKMWFVVSLDKIAEIDPQMVTKIRGSIAAPAARTEEVQTSDNNSANLGL